VELTGKELPFAQPVSDPAQKKTVALAAVEVDGSGGGGVLALSIISREPHPAIPSKDKTTAPRRARRA
jgi:hypothetical protein